VHLLERARLETDVIGAQQNPIVDFQASQVTAEAQPTAELHRNHLTSEKDEKGLYDPTGEDVTISPAHDQISDDLIPTEEDMLTLRKVPAPMK
jgi:hypothetical protein